MKDDTQVARMRLICT